MAGRGRAQLSRTFQAFTLCSLYSRRLLVFFLFIPSLFAQSLQVSVDLDTTDGTLGDVFHATWQVQHSPNQAVQFPVLDQRVTTFEILEQNQGVEQENITALQLAVAVYDSVGPHDFPDLKATVISPVDTQVIKLPGFRVEIHSVLTAEDSTFHPIKPIHPVRLPFNWWYIIYGVIAVVTIYLLYRYWPRRIGKNEAGKEKVVVILPEEAHVIALRELNELQRSTLLETGDFKAYYSWLTEIVRRYFENRFLIDALEMTTTEVLLALKNGILGPDRLRDSEELLTQGDLVKFAKFIPTSTQAEAALKLAINLVETTRVQTETTMKKSDVKQQAEVEDIS
ncbi:MAG: hypothetical protein K9N11_08690 [Lentisphaeria bacterium]|nr:hypothetical protein [Candidatus Neomarinimicrobiota bacterium]MCF7842913.1 hypothetical protein [Lentisphaeria bacterium]